MTECMPLPSSPIHTGISENDKEEIREMICCLIDEYVQKNILEYMYPDFQQKIYDAISPIVELLD